ncbi:GAF domain-containing protein [Lewinella sp. LCG006]|uniref:GAF domain-containing protein n=1 Tax=Lewinella sp. LCG006 TaxID=3231911 RepID=UPI0034602B60
MNKRPNIIIVDDDVQFVKDLQRQLKYRDVQVDHVFNAGNELLEHLTNLGKENIEYTAVLIDFVLPDVSGRELVNQLIKDYPKLDVIVMSGQDLQGSIRAYAMGAYAIMSKPIDYNELTFTLEELTHRNQIADHIAEDLRIITGFDCILVWEIVWDDYPNYRITGHVGKGADRDFVEKTRMDAVNYPRVRKMQSGNSVYYEDIATEEDFQHHREAADRNWVSLLSFPFRLEDGRLVGWIDCYKTEKFTFADAQDAAQKRGYLKRYAKIAGENIQAQRLTKQTRIIHETSQNLAGTLHEELIYKSILNKALEVTYADYGCVYRFSPGKGELSLIAKTGKEVTLADEIIPTGKGGVIGKLTKSQGSIYVKDVTKEEKGIYDPQKDRSTRHEAESGSLMAVTLRRGDRTLGVLLVKTKHPDFFIPDDLQFLTSMAAIAAVGMERQKLTHHLEEVSRRAQMATNFKDLSTYVVEAVKDLTDGTVNLWMMSKEDGEGDEFLRLVDSSMPSLLKVDERIPTAPGESVAGFAMEKGGYVLIDDLDKHTGSAFINQKVNPRDNGHSILVVPLLGKNKEKLGVLTVLHTDINKFSPDDGLLIQHFANQAALALQGQRQLEILQALARIGQELMTTLSDTKTYLQKVATLACEVSQATSVVIYPYDYKKKLFYANEYNVAAGKIKFVKSKLTVKPRQKGIAALIRTYGAVRVEEGSKEEPLRIYFGDINGAQLISEPGSAIYKQIRQFVEDSDFIRREKIQSFIGVSLVAETKKDELEEVAVIYFNYRSPRHFTQEELRVINIFCHQVANVIHRNRLFNELEEERKLIEGVHNSALTILKEQGQEKRLNKIVEEATSLLGAEGGEIYLTINGSQKDLQLVGKHNLPDEKMKLGAILRQSDGVGMALTVARTGKYLIENDYPKSKYKVPKMKSFFSAVVEVPLLLQGKVIGVLGVFDKKEKQEFTNTHVRILERLAAQAALAIYNVLLYDELDALYMAGVEISQNKGLQPMAKNILEQLKRVIDYDKASIQQINGPDQERITLAYLGRNDIDTEKEFTRPVKEDRLIWAIYKQRESKVISHTARSKEWDGEFTATKSIRSWVGIPLLIGDKVLGILMLDHNTPGYYTETDLPKLERFALQAAIGISNALLYEELNVLNLSSKALGLWDKLMSLSTEEILIKDIPVFHSSIFTNMLEVIDEVFEDENFNLSIFLAGDELDTQTYFNLSQLREFPIYERIKFISNLDSLDLLGEFIFPVLVNGKEIGKIGFSKSIPFIQSDRKILNTLVFFLQMGLQYIEIATLKVRAFKRRFNPYITGPPIRLPNEFFGRTEHTKSIINQIHNNHFLILGERRIGKTSLLYYLEHHIAEASDDKYVFYPVYMDLEGTLEKDFWYHFADTIQSISGKVHSKKGEKYEFFDFQYDLKQTLRRLKKSSPNRLLRIVILMDEIDVFRTYEDDTLSKMRKIFQESDELKVIMAGVSYTELTEDINSAWYNQLKLIRIGEIKEEQARLLITQPVAQRYTFSEAVIEAIIKKSDCKPLAIQKLCSDAVENMLKRVAELPGFSTDALEILPEDIP